MKLNPFRIEEYYAKYEFSVQYMLSSSDAQSRKLVDLFEWEPTARKKLDDLWLGYTEAAGAPYLRETISTLYQKTRADDVLVTAAAEEAIFITYHALISSEDHVIVETPCYESALELARSTGATVSEWERYFEDSWANDFDSLIKLIRPNTKFIYINTPSNPTGTLMDKDVFVKLMALAEEQNIIVFCDEVYRELEHDPAARLPAAADLYSNAISLGSMSKSYGLPGLRLGWMICRNPEVIKKLMNFKLYTSICNSAPSEFMSDLALRHRDKLIERNLNILHHNLPLMKDFMVRHSNIFSWVEPQASPIGFPRVNVSEDIMHWCEKIAHEVGILLLPGSVYDQPRHIRISYGRSDMPEALHLLDNYLNQLAK
ncbi:MAG: aminotransferase class I/II-fold pyridoxal phosphate-dependent enzyme [Leptolyngbya sp. SIO1E4]|nr:aminotransferase class I/II-fold pyridoxal phosphate-dependent enzyme [Leptolyngbya sp. SIO1E4]